MRNIFLAKISLVPIREMTDVLSVESKAIEISRDTWVRMKIGIYKGDLAKVLNEFLLITIMVLYILNEFCLKLLGSLSNSKLLFSGCRCG